MRRKPARSKVKKKTRARRAGHVLKLYIAGMSPRSVAALRSIKRICDRHLKTYDLEVVDLYRNPAKARDKQIIAAPTLVKELPAPLRKLIGNLSDESRVISGLGVEKK